MDDLALTALIFIAATLYSTVGHAGASGYLAAFALFGLAPEEMRPAALTLNILVAAIACYRYTRAGQSDWRLLIPFILTSIPAAYVGGTLHVPPEIYRPMVGVVLLLSAVQFIRTAKRAARDDAKAGAPDLLLCPIAGAVLGLLAGLTGTGGGIFLSPLLIFMHWAPTRHVSGIAAGFILLNSIAGLIGNVKLLPSLPEALPYWALAALLGGLLGTQLGSKTLPLPAIRRVLGAVLIIAGGKMLLG